MKYLILFFVFNLFSPPGPPVTVEWQIEKSQDLGLLDLNSPKSISFPFKNITEEPITVDNVRTTCGCTAPNWDFAPILPGEIGKIDIEYDAKKPGYFYKKIKVFFSGQRRAEILVIEGEVKI
ncbi:MAG: DUF1573 domain-containing protein [Saprospiraceae bacterium]|nr:DUF1573 domain-containing protein [Saprospiraceae bacterium]